MEGYNNTQQITPPAQTNQLFKKVSYSTAVTSNTFESFEAKWEGNEHGIDVTRVEETYDINMTRSVTLWTRYPLGGHTGNPNSV